jgi:hypothetical protein
LKAELFCPFVALDYTLYSRSLEYRIYEELSSDNVVVCRWVFADHCCQLVQGQFYASWITCSEFWTKETEIGLRTDSLWNQLANFFLSIKFQFSMPSSIVILVFFTSS